MNINEQKNILGIIFFILSILMLGYMFMTPLNHIIIHMDEYFTITIADFPIMDIINITANDVHPPFHYLLLKIVSDFLTIFGASFDKLFVYKVVSIVPYLLILIFSFTKIKNEWGYLTAGLFSFSIAVMTEFFKHFLTIRMYSWAVLFVLLAFIYLKDVLEKDEIKAWCLLTIFSVLGALTHYFAAISLAVMYILLLIHFYISDKQKIKHWVASVISAIILYSPWILVLPRQISFFSSVSSSTAVTLEKAIGYFGYYGSIENIGFSLIAILILVVIMVMYIKYSDELNKTDKFYIFCGVWVYLGVIIIGILLSILSFERYLLPAAAILLFVISIII